MNFAERIADRFTRLAHVAARAFGYIQRVTRRLDNAVLADGHFVRGALQVLEQLDLMSDAGGDLLDVPDNIANLDPETACLVGDLLNDRRSNCGAGGKLDVVHRTNPLSDDLGLPGIFIMTAERDKRCCRPWT